MKRIFWRSGGGKGKEEEIQDVSLDIVLANKEDILAKVALTSRPPRVSFSKYIFQLKNEYKSFLTRKVEIERDLVEVESQEVELR